MLCLSLVLLLKSHLLLATIPTFGDALEALNSLCQDLSTTLNLQVSDISAELSAKELIAVDNIQEVCFSSSTYSSFLRPLLIILMTLVDCRRH